MILQFKVNPGFAKPKMIGTEFRYVPTDEERKRITFGQTRESFPIGSIRSVHPSNNTVTVEVLKVKESWVKRVILGEEK